MKTNLIFWGTRNDSSNSTFRALFSVGISELGVLRFQYRAWDC